MAKEIAAPDGYIADIRPIAFHATESDFITVQLVTCGGEFVGQPLGYANNDFVFATPLTQPSPVPVRTNDGGS